MIAALIGAISEIRDQGTRSSEQPSAVRCRHRSGSPASGYRRTPYTRVDPCPPAAVPSRNFSKTSLDSWPSQPDRRLGYGGAALAFPSLSPNTSFAPYPCPLCASWRQGPRRARGRGANAPLGLEVEVRGSRERRKEWRGLQVETPTPTSPPKGGLPASCGSAREHAIDGGDQLGATEGLRQRGGGTQLLRDAEVILGVEAAAARDRDDLRGGL
jgi:hypothetical protein